MIPVFVTGIGTDVGKTLVSAIITKALGCSYWKPIQAGSPDNTDTQLVQQLTGNPVWNESYLLKKPASPHISAREENVIIDINKIFEDFTTNQHTLEKHVVIEGAGGLLVPLTEDQTVADLVKRLKARVIIVSRNYLGSINHSLLTAAYCRAHDLDVAGWIFTDEYMNYEAEIGLRSGYPVIGKIPFLNQINPETIAFHADNIRIPLIDALNKII